MGSEMLLLREREPPDSRGRPDGSRKASKKPPLEARKALRLHAGTGHSGSPGDRGGLLDPRHSLRFRAWLDNAEQEANPSPNEPPQPCHGHPFLVEPPSHPNSLALPQESPNREQAANPYRIGTEFLETEYPTNPKEAMGSAL